MYNSNNYGSNQQTSDMSKELNMTKKPFWKKLSPVGLAIIGIVILAAIIMLCSSTTIIRTSFTGVVTEWGQVSDKPLDAGFHFKKPFVTKIHKCNNRLQEETFKTTYECESSEKTTVHGTNITIAYRIMATAAVDLYTNLGTFDDLITDDMVSSALKSVLVTLDDTKVTNRNIVEPAMTPVLQNYIDTRYGKNKITVQQITVGNLGFDEEYEKAITNKSIAQKEAEQAAIENQKKIDEAKATAEAKRAEAEGERDAKLLEAEGNKALAKSITPELNEYKLNEKWNGVAPQVVGGTGIVDFRGSTKK